MLFVVLCPGTPEGSTGSGSGLKSVSEDPLFIICMHFFQLQKYTQLLI